MDEQPYNTDPSPFYLLNRPRNRDRIDDLAWGDDDFFNLVQHPLARRLGVLLHEACAAGRIDLVTAWFCGVGDFYLELHPDAEGADTLRHAINGARGLERLDDVEAGDWYDAHWLACFATQYRDLGRKYDAASVWECAQHAMCIVVEATGDTEGALNRCAQIAYRTLFAQVQS